MKKYFILFHDQKEIIDALSDKQAGQLFKACFDFQSGKDPKLDPLLNLVFIPFRQQFERDEKRYEEKVEKNRENANKRWKKQNKLASKKDAFASDRIFLDAKHANTNTNTNTNTSYKKKETLVNPLTPELKNKLWNELERASALEVARQRRGHG